MRVSWVGLRECVSEHAVSLLLLVTAVIIGLHYIFFVAQINTERECRGDYINVSLQSINDLHVLLKDSYDNQNRLTVEYATATAREVPERDSGEFSAEVQEVFAGHYERLVELDKRFAEIQAVELPEC